MSSGAARIAAAAGALGLVAFELVWESAHGGVVTHHLLNRADLPGFSNAWGLVLLPAIAALAVGSRGGAAVTAGERLIRWMSFLLPFAFGAALALGFKAEWPTFTQGVFFTAAALGIVLPTAHARCLLGWTFGMLPVFGGVLPVIVGGAIVAVSGVVHGIRRYLCRRLRARPS